MSALARLDAPSFHSRLGELLRVELVALGAFLVRKFPEVLAPIEDGRLCFSTVAVVASVLAEENRSEVLPRFHGLAKQEALELAAEIRPRGVVPARTVATRTEAVEAVGRSEGAEPAVQAAAPETFREITQEFGRFVHPGELGSAGAAAGAAVADATTIVPMTGAASRVHLTVSREFLSLLKQAKAGESHRNPGATDEQVLKLALEALIEKQSKRKASVSAKVKREVVARDGGKCQWRLPDGELCGATAMREIDHVIPRGKGGPDTVDNCRVTCRAHDLEAARQIYGDELMGLFTRGAHGPVAREEVAGCAAPGKFSPGSSRRSGSRRGRSGRRDRAAGGRWRLDAVRSLRPHRSTLHA